MLHKQGDANMKRKTAQRNGSAILWAVLVMLMISLISAGIILVDRMYYMREQEENNRVQAKFYAESAITLVQQDILKEGTVTDEATGATYQSIFVSDGNTAETFTISLPDAGNWECTVTVNHSVVNDSETDANKRRLSGEIYLTARITRNTAGSGEKELSEVCGKLSVPANATQWRWDGYYQL